MARPARATPVHHERSRENGVSNSVYSSRSTVVRRPFPVKRVRCALCSDGAGLDAHIGGVDG